MAAALDKALGTGSMSAPGTSFTITTTNTTASGSDIWVAVSVSGAPTVTVADNGGGGTYTQEATKSNSSANLWLFRAIPAGAVASGTVITVTLNSSQSRACGSAFSTTGVDQTGSSVDVAASTSGGFNATTWTSPSITTLTAGDLLLVAGATNGAAGATDGTLINSFASPNGSKTQDTQNLDFLYKVGGGTGSEQGGGTWGTSQSGCDNAAFIIAYKAAVAGAAFDKVVVPNIAYETQQIVYCSRSFSGYGNAPADWLISDVQRNLIATLIFYFGR